MAKSYTDKVIDKLTKSALRKVKSSIRSFFRKFKKLKIISLIAAIIFLAIIFIPKILPNFKLIGNNIKETITSSQLEKAVDVATLSTAEFTYNGIAQIYKDYDRTKVAYNVCYDSKIKVGIDMSQIKFKIDEENKMIFPMIPKISVQKPIIDTSKIEFIPNNVTGDLKEIIAACENDAYYEASYSKELIAIAEENLKSTIEALLIPIVEPNDYSIVWD